MTASAPKSETSIELLTGRRVMCAGKTRWQVLEEIAAAQRNRASRAQLLLAGFSGRMLNTAVDRGQFHREHRGVYLIGGDAQIELGRETAALLIAPGLVLVGLSVLIAHGCVSADPGQPVHIAGRGRPDPREGVIVHRYADLGRVRPVMGLPMTTVERALLDAADTLTGRPLERAVDEALSARKTSRTKLRETAEQAVGRRGREELIMLADARRPNSETKREYAELALGLIRAARLPEPETEVSMLGFQMDFFFREAGVVVEVDPFTIHGVIRANFNRDRRKARACREAGLELISVTGDELTETPLVFVSDVAQTIARRSLRQAN